MSITMKEDAELLDEVVVIGYGSARKGDLTGPISSVKGSFLNRTFYSNAVYGYAGADFGCGGYSFFRGSW